MSLLKTLWEKEKLLIMSNFSFSHSVFYLSRELCTIFIKSEIVVCKLFEFGRVSNLSFGKGLTLLFEKERIFQVIIHQISSPLYFKKVFISTLYYTRLTFHDLAEEASDNIVGKGDNAGNQHFSPLPTEFFTQSRQICHLGHL